VETLAGVVLCQAITSAFIVAAGATLGGKSGSLMRVEQIAAAFTATLGGTAGNAVFVLGLVGGALVAAIVVCLTLAWTFGEVLGMRHSLEHQPMEAPWFYGTVGAMIVAGGSLVASGINLVELTVAAGVVNALLLPVVLGFLFWLGRTALPQALRLRGFYAVVVAAAFLLISGVALYAGLVGAWSSWRGT
jgi:Mn2+/Fe2+ NRAMP family transporter